MATWKNRQPLCDVCERRRNEGETGWVQATHLFAGFPHGDPRRLSLSYHCPDPTCRPSHYAETVKPLGTYAEEFPQVVP